MTNAIVTIWAKQSVTLIDMQLVVSFLSFCLQVIYLWGFHKKTLVF